MAGRIGAVGRMMGRVGRRGEVGWLKLRCLSQLVTLASQMVTLRARHGL